MSGLIDPFDPFPMGQQPAEESPKAQPNLQTDSAEAIVLALADCDPLAWVAPQGSLASAMGRKEHVFLECVLCHGEIPHGHTGSCPHWRAVLYKKAKEGR